jgi:hypothetical protein
VPCTWYVVKRASDSHIAYNPLPGITPESEVRTLAAVILECHAKRKADEGSDDEDVETKVRLHKERRSPCDMDD